MAVEKNDSWGRGELYEMLCLMMIGYCLWLIGTKTGFFDYLLFFTTEHGLVDLVMLAACLSLGAVAASVRKSFLLRKAMIGRAEAEMRSESIARHDALTGLANRRFFLELFDCVAKSCRPGDQLAVMVIDLDRFKPVNDVHGHAAGNAVICAVADRLLQIVSPRGAVARLGGDEFAALVRYNDGPDGLFVLAEQIIAAICSPIHWNHNLIHVNATVGIAPVTCDNSEPEGLLHAADLAMYQGKRDGRGTFRIFAAEMGAALKARAEFEADLRSGIARGEFVPFFQPIVRLPSEDLVGFEVLARWNHPTKGLIAPNDFIPVAEQTGLIGDLFYDLLRQACSTAQHWPGHLRISVNVAPQQLQDSLLPQRILAILSETGFAPRRLEVEITETAIINDLQAARTALMSLQNIGVKIALDDFGTGYSSLYHLKELRFDKLKIDRSYVTSLMQGSEGAKLVDAIIQLGASLGMETTAEGIETSSNLDWLSRQGCTFGQGFLFGQPMPKDAADELLGSKERLDQSDAIARSAAA
jgi:diguanylate cyclase (GGDEF)-like protein